MSSRVPTREPSLQATLIGRRTALLSGLALPLGLLVAGAAPASALQQAKPAQTARSPRLALPAPTGHHRLGTTWLYLVDKSRPDPWVPAIPFRGLVIQIWYPAYAVDGYPRAPYYTPALARAYEKYLGLPVALNWPVTDAHLGAPMQQREGGWPVVLYSAGLGDERSDTTCLVEELARTVFCSHCPLTAKEINSRVADVSFVLDQLAVISRGGNPGHEHWPLPRGLHRALDLHQVGMFGHSDGGSTTAHAMHADARIKAGVNLDGTFWTPQAVAGSDRPLLLFGKQDLDPFQASTWAEFWKNQRGPKLQLNLLGSTHTTFTDFAALVPQVAPILGEPPSRVIHAIGTINGQRAITVERTYINAWFDRYLRHHDSRLTIPIPPELVKLLRARIRKYGATPDGRIFQTARGGIIQDSAPAEDLRPLHRRAGRRRQQAHRPRPRHPGRRARTR